jgi:hypothetical protein
MANPYQIDSAFRDLGVLFAAEHSEGDDEGATQVQNLVKLLRRFKQHEIDEHKQDVSPVREATYQLNDGRHVYYDDGKESLRDAADLYAVLDEQHKTGSPNVENQQALHILARLQSGDGLGEMHIGTLTGLLRKHAGAIDKYRKARGQDGQDLLSVASAGPSARISPSQEEAA